MTEAEWLLTRNPLNMHDVLHEIRSDRKERLLGVASAVVALATSIYADKAFDRMPILADALEESGCENVDILLHCRIPGEHVRGCWVIDLLTGRK